MTSLYDIFIRETIEWERQKGKVEGADERDLRRVLAYLAYYTFVEPQLGEWLEDAVVGASRLETKTVRSIREFWLKTGLLDEDSEQHTIRFQHNGFLSYGVAYAMADLWHAGQRDKVDELCRRFESDAAHSLIVTLFLGLSGQ